MREVAQLLRSKFLKTYHKADNQEYSLRSELFASLPFLDLGTLIFWSTRVSNSNNVKVILS